MHRHSNILHVRSTWVGIISWTFSAVTLLPTHSLSHLTILPITYFTDLLLINFFIDLWLMGLEVYHFATFVRFIPIKNLLSSLLHNFSNYVSVNEIIQIIYFPDSQSYISNKWQNKVSQRSCNHKQALGTIRTDNVQSDENAKGVIVEKNRFLPHIQRKWQCFYSTLAWINDPSVEQLALVSQPGNCLRCASLEEIAFRCEQFQL